MTNKIFSCTEHNPKDFDNKKLMVFENELEGRAFQISALVSIDGKTFTLNRTAVGIASAFANRENQIAVVKKSIDEAVFQIMEKPNSRFLNNQCDFVVFINSPKRKMQYTETDYAVTTAKALQA